MGHAPANSSALPTSCSEMAHSMWTFHGCKRAQGSLQQPTFMLSNPSRVSVSRDLESLAGAPALTEHSWECRLRHGIRSTAHVRVRRSSKQMCSSSCRSGKDRLQHSQGVSGCEAGMTHGGSIARKQKRCQTQERHPEGFCMQSELILPTPGSALLAEQSPNRSTGKSKAHGLNALMSRGAIVLSLGLSQLHSSACSASESRCAFECACCNVSG